MLTFKEFQEVSDEKDDEKAVEVVRKGMNLNKYFWDDFLSLCSNSDGMAQLLGAPKDKITSLNQKINKIKDEIEKKDSSETKKRDKIIKTGDK